MNFGFLRHRRIVDFGLKKRGNRMNITDYRFQITDYRQTIGNLSFGLDTDTHFAEENIFQRHRHHKRSETQIAKPKSQITIRKSQITNPKTTIRRWRRNPKSLIPILLFIFLICSTLFSQDAVKQSDLNASLQSHIRVLARAQKDRIILRWGVTKPAVWLIGNKVGYKIESAQTFDGKIPAPSSFKPITDSPIKPWSNEKWQQYFDSHPSSTDETDYALVASAILDENRSESRSTPAIMENLGTLKDERNRLDMRFSFAMLAADKNINAADGLGLRFVDEKITNGKTYCYRIFLAGSSPIYKVDTGYVIIAAVPAEHKQPKDLLKAQENDSNITLFWTTMKEYSSYSVERSSDGGKTFSRLNKNPLITLRPSDMTDTTAESYVDAQIENYMPFIYRVSGSTAFADEELVGEAEAMGRDRTPPGKPFVPNPKQISSRAVKIIWTMDEPIANDLSGFMILRDTIESGAYIPLHKKLLPGSSREFIDTTFFEYEPNYYIIASVDTAGNMNHSMPSYVALIDSIPPMIPTWVKGTMDSIGIVKLILHANHERDCMGYRILRANAPDHEFSSIVEWYDDELSHARDTLIIDTVDVMSLTKYVYYRATALDSHFNESDLSEILAVPRPDRIPPVAPVITDVFVTDTSVTLSIVPSSSEDVKSHTLFRRLAGKEKWEMISELSRDVSEVTDKKVTMNTTYEYELQAIDSSGLKSDYSISVTARPYDTGVRPGVRNLNTLYDETKKQIMLTWQYDGLQEEHYYLIYRSMNESGLKKYAIVQDSKEKSFIDAQLQGKGRYEYAVKVMTKSGAESKMSEKVVQEIK